MNILNSFIVLTILVSIFTGCGDSNKSIKKEKEIVSDIKKKKQIPSGAKSAEGIFSAGDDQNVLEGENVTLKSSILTKDKKFTNISWKDNGEIIGDNDTILTDKLTVGRHDITLEMIDSNGVVYIDTIVINIKKENIKNTPPLAQNINISLDEDTTSIISLKGSDGDGDELNYLLVSYPKHGKLSGSTAHLKYTPDLNFNGEDSYTFKTNDGTIDSKLATVFIKVNPINDAPIFKTKSKDKSIEAYENFSLDLNIIDDDNDKLAFTITPEWLNYKNGKIQAIPDIKHTGTHHVKIVATDNNGGSSSFEFDLTVTRRDHITIKDITPILISEDAMIFPIELHLEDENNIADKIKYEITHAINGFTHNQKNQFIFDPSSYQSLKKDENKSQIVSISAEVGDLKDTIDLNITIIGKNDKPKANFTYILDYNNAVYLDASSSKDIDNNKLSYKWYDNGVMINNNKKSFSVNNLGLGEHNITLTISDTYLEDNITKNLHLKDMSPSLQPFKRFSTTEDNQQPIKGKASVKNGTKPFLFSTSSSLKGFTIDESSGTFRFTPPLDGYQSLNEGESTSNTIDIKVIDKNGLEDHKNLTINITGINDSPIGRNDTFKISEDASITFIDVLKNDDDIDDNNSMLKISSLHNNTSPAILSNGKIEFTPKNLKEDQNETYKFSYLLKDEHNASSQDTNVTVTIIGSYDAPVPTLQIPDLIYTKKPIKLTATIENIDEYPITKEWSILPSNGYTTQNSASNTLDVTFEEAGDYNLTFTIHQNNKTDINISKIITANEQYTLLLKTGDPDDGGYGADRNFTRDDDTDIVTDNVSNLMWQDDANTTILVKGTDIKNNCENLRLGDYSDWRVPNKLELYMLARKTKQNDRFIDKAFTNLGTEDISYWTSKKEDPTILINFYDAKIFSPEESVELANKYLRCVRGEEIKVNLENNNSLILDKTHNLMWIPDETREQKTWNNAKEYCLNLNYQNYQNWRLPNIYELYSIAKEDGLTKPFAKFTNSATFWSSTSSCPCSSSYDDAYCLDLSNGLDFIKSKNSTRLVKCVRSID